MRIKLKEFISKTNSVTEPLKLSRGDVPSGTGTMTNQGSAKPYNTDDIEDAVANLSSGMDSYSFGQGSSVVTTKRMMYEEAPYNSEADSMSYDDFVKFLEEKNEKDSINKYYETKSLDDMIKERLMMKKETNDNDLLVDSSEYDIDNIKSRESKLFNRLDSCLDWVKSLSPVERHVVSRYIKSKLS